MTLLPSDVEVRELPDGVRYVLPRRRLGRRWRTQGLPLLLLVCICAAVLGIWGVAEVVAVLRGQAGPPRLGDVLLALKAWPALLIVAASAFFGLGLAFGHLEVECRRGWLRATERVGPFRWSRSRRLGLVHSYAVLSTRDKASRPVNSYPAGAVAALHAEFRGPSNPSFWLTGWTSVLADPSEDLAVLVARCPGGQSLLVAGGYPRDWLKGLAEDLTRRHQGEQHSAGLDRSRPAVAVAEWFAEDLEQPQVRARPPHSLATLEHDPGGLTVTLPPVGVWRSRYGRTLLVGGTLGAVAFGGISSLLVFAALSQDLVILVCCEPTTHRRAFSDSAS